ncbi:MAG: lysophospholipid acyltransferase family protein [Anaerolineae bacterium]|nr:lysophospholipid acyltransferase family protein [Anaerolineae bacterium]
MAEIQEMVETKLEYTPPGGITTAPEVGDLVPRRGGAFAHGFARLMMGLFGWKVAGYVPNAKKFMVVGAPHTSNVDWFIVMGAAFILRVRISWMAKHSLFNKPWGGVLRWLGGVPIDRRQAQGTVGSAIEQFNQHDELILCITPEGTRAEVKGKWKKGFYYMAEGADVPVVVAAFDYGNKVVRFGPTFKPTGDIEADMPVIYSYVEGVVPRHPQKEMEVGE